MKIRRLEPMPGSGYEFMQGLIIAANNETEARDIAARTGGELSARVWHNAELSTCHVLNPASMMPGLIGFTSRNTIV